MATLTENVQLKFTADTSQAEAAMGSFVQKVDTPGMIKEAQTDGLIDAAKIENTSERMDSLNDVMTKMKDAFRDILGSMKVFSSTLDDLDKKLPAVTKQRKDESQTSTDKKELAEYNQGVRGVTGVVQYGSQTVQNLANGNMAGAVIGGVNNAGSFLTRQGLSSDNKDLAKKLLLGGGIAAGIGAILTGGNALADAYADTLDNQDILLRTFGGNKVTTNTAAQNADIGIKLRSDAVKSAVGTGLSTDEYIRVATSLGQYGITNQNRAYDIATQSGMLSRYTGADLNQVSNFAGMIERYGGNGTQALDNAYKAARASGLDKNQFGEFLTGLQSVVESGISKGFIRSADDVAESLATVSMLSGNNPIWQGKNGAEKYNQISTAMGNATSLQSTSSMLLYQAMAKSMGNPKDYIDVMVGLENGNWADKSFRDSYIETLNNAYGNDRSSKIATIRENFGVNYKGALELEKIFNNTSLSDAEAKKRIEAVKENKDMKSDASTMTEAINQLKNSVEQMARPTFTVKYAGIDKVGSVVDNIYKFLVRDRSKGYNYDNVKTSQYLYYTTDANGKAINQIASDPNIPAGMGLNYNEKVFSMEDMAQEAGKGKKGYKQSTAREEKAYQALVNAKEAGIDPALYEKYFKEIANSFGVNSRTDAGRYVANTEQMDKAIKALESLTMEMKEGITVNQEN